MTKDEVLTYITASEDAAELDAIKDAAYRRAKALRTAERQRLVEEYWKRTGFWKVGDKLYCGTQGTFVGGPMQRGDYGILYAVQPRKKMLWLTINKKTVSFSAEMVFRYKLQPDKPANPITDDERAKAKRLAEVL